jgi:hypothetical protein
MIVATAVRARETGLFLLWKQANCGVAATSDNGNSVQALKNGESSYDDDTRSEGTCPDGGLTG